METITNRTISLTNDTINKQDIDNLISWLQTYPRLTKGEKTIAFEEQWSKMFGVKYSVFVNSGSSCILLALYALIVLKKLKNQKIIIPAISWATDLSSPMILGLEPILVDCNMQNLAVDIDHLKEVIKRDSPAAIVLVSVLGLCPNMDEIMEICNSSGIEIITDNCESLGTKYEGKHLESFGLMSCSSLFFSHHCSTIEGGMVCTDNKEVYDTLKQLRSHGWDRDLDFEKQKELREKYNVDDFNALYQFYIPSFNLRSTDLQAQIGINQLCKAESFFITRERNFQTYQKNIKNDYWKPIVREQDFTSNFCYPIIHPKRDEIVKALKENGVEVRPLISGSMGLQPMYIEKYGELSLPNADIVHTLGMYVPNNQAMTEEDVIYICTIINNVINK